MLSPVDKKIQDANTLHKEIKEYLSPKTDASDTVKEHIYLILQNKKRIALQVIILFISVTTIYIAWKPNFLTYSSKDSYGTISRYYLKKRLLIVSIITCILLYCSVLAMSEKIEFLKKTIYKTY